MFCDRCGAPNRDDARFCRSCGAPAAETDTRPLLAAAPAGEDVPEPLRRALEGKYEVARLLGRGGMGRVYLAHDLALDRPVALKVLDLGGDPGPRDVERFLREARTAARLRHPGIVSVHGVGRHEGICWFTMDHIQGDTLESYVRSRGPLSEEEARSILRAILGAVGHAHAQGVVHRDLKPGNVMRDASGHVVVLDFGLARSLDASISTTSRVVVGTPQYLSPEQVEGHPATPRSDLYAVGLVHVFLRTGSHLVEAASVSDAVVQHLSGSLRARAERLPALRGAPGALLSLLERDPERRPARAEDVLAALGDDAAGPATVPLPTPPAPALDAPAPAPPLSPHRQVARHRLQALLEKMPRRRDDG